MLELQAFVGSNAHFYLRKWEPRLVSPDGETGMNWAAFFLTYWWMAYRRMHLNTALCVAASVIMSISLHALFIFAFKSKSGAPLSAVLLANLMFCLVCGLCANGWYLSHAKRKIAEAHAHGLEGQYLLSTLAQRGGTSWPSVFGWMFGPLAVLFCGGLMLGLLLAIAAAPR